MRHARFRIRVAAVVLCAAVLVSPGTAAAQSGPPEEVVKARALIQAKDFDGAIKILEDYVQRTPAAATGWLLLGNAYRQKGDLDRAIEANLKVVQPRIMRLQGMFNAAGVR
jgi:predicted Zn-dependent protease